MAVFGVEQCDGVGGHDDAGARPEHPRQRSLRRQSLLQTEAVCPEFEGDPAESLVGFQQQSIDGLTEHRPRSTGPGLSLGDAVLDDAQFVAVQLDDRQRTDGQYPLSVALVEQILLAVGLGQRGRQLGGQVRWGDVDRQRKRRRSGACRIGFDANLGHD